MKPSFLSFADMQEIPDLICFSHIRWNSNYQRPQHLLSRYTSYCRVFYMEEPVFNRNCRSGYLDITISNSKLWIIVPNLPVGLSSMDINVALAKLLDLFFTECRIQQYMLWYNTPMAYEYTNHLEPLLTIYDCTDELVGSGKIAPRAKFLEEILLQRADLVFMASQTLFDSRKDKYSSIYLFPNSVDATHFESIKNKHVENKVPTIGYCGAIDERIDMELIHSIAKKHPEWNMVFIGPVELKDVAVLPQSKNILYLGHKTYKELPDYMADWSLAIVPFIHNQLTRYINPVKTAEYLAAGKPVISTSIADIVRLYGETGLVNIADGPDNFIRAIEEIITEKYDQQRWRSRVNTFLESNSWDQTWARMTGLIIITLRKKMEFFFPSFKVGLN